VQELLSSCPKLIVVVYGSDGTKRVFVESQGRFFFFLRASFLNAKVNVESTAYWAKRHPAQLTPFFQYRREQKKKR